jgi:DNA-directed RNA polymerase specialized sigma24 family protein
MIVVPKPDTPIGRALKKRRELQAAIKRIMQELEDVEKYIALHRRFSVEDEGNKGETAPMPVVLSQTGHGQAQPIFERMAIDAIRQAGRPMQSGELVEAFRARGHSLGGNEIRTAWNRLWLAKDHGVLINYPRLGYWPAEDPPPANLDQLKPLPRKPSGGKRMQTERRGKKKGRQPYLSDAQRQEVMAMFARGMSGPQIAEAMGVSPPTIYGVRKKIKSMGENGAPE